MVPGCEEAKPGKQGAAMVGSWGWRIGLILMVLEGLTGRSLPQGDKPVNHGIAVWLELPAEVSAGQRVPIRLKVKNSGHYAIELPLGGRPAHDVVVTRRDGTEIWRWMHGRAIQDILELRRLLPGEELTFEAEWRQRDSAGKPVAPGTYWVRGVVLAGQPGQQLETEPKPLAIVP
jgi:hypothetical protein